MSYIRSQARELLHDRYGRDNISLILTGMPGIEKCFSRYALYGRGRFAHECRPLAQGERQRII